MLAFQRALDVTSHNIANANTPGYSRQVAHFSARLGSGSGAGYIGGGTQISSIKRAYDDLKGQQLQSSTTGFTRLNTLTNLASRIDSLMADADTGLNRGLQSYFGAMQDVANDPTSIPTRQAVLGAADTLTSRFQSLDGQLDEVENEINGRLRLAVDDVNRLASAIADVNNKIALANGTGNSPNDLLDERDQLVLELSSQVSVTTLVQDDNTMSVFIGSGQSLVLGGEARQLGVVGSEFDATSLEVVYQSRAGSTALDTGSTGGNLGGLLEFRGRILQSARQSLGLTATAVSNRLNEQSASGMDLRGALGSDLFSISPPTVLPSFNNTGSGTASVSVADLGALSGSDYLLEFDGVNYTLTDKATNTAVAMSGSGSAIDPFVADGLSIVVAGAPAAGDRMLLHSTANAAGSIQSVVTDPQALALAAPTRSSASLANLGNAAISGTTVADPTDPLFLSTSVVEFTSANTYSINGAGSFAFVDGDPVTVNGSTFVLSGAPSVGDQFTIEANFGASGDNSNGLLLAGVQAERVLSGGTISINENYGRLVSEVGSTTRQLQSNLDAQSVLRTNAEESLISNSGVNLDEEAANLIRYQQAYQAVAQVVSVASTLFDTLLAATRR